MALSMDYSIALAPFLSHAGLAAESDFRSSQKLLRATQ
jgi:hypothetical protein